MLEHLIIFTRYPIPGTTKTRLIPALGATGAANLQRQLTEHTLNTVRSLAVDISIYFTGGELAQMQTWLGTDWHYHTQIEGDLGDRLLDAFQTSQAQGYQRTVIIGIDCPELTAAILHDAFAGLNNHDAVFGKAHDGGYYLIGLQRPIPELLQAIPWSTAAVFQETWNRCQALGLQTLILPTLHDIDNPSDLPIWERIAHP